MKIPSHPAYLYALAMTLALSSGQRALDLLGVMDHMDGRAFREPADTNPAGAALLPIFMVPLAALLCSAIYRRYPNHPVSLFHWRKSNKGSQTLMTAFFVLFCAAPLFSAVIFAAAVPAFIEDEDTELAADAALNFWAELGSIYFYLSLRAVSSCPLRPRVKSENE